MEYTRWNDVAGCVGGSLYVEDGKTYNECTATHLKALDKYNFPENEVIEMDIHFLSSGYHLPMSMYGGSQNAGWPEEHSDERLIESIEITAGDLKVSLPQEVIDEIAPDFEYLIENELLEADDVH